MTGPAILSRVLAIVPVLLMLVVIVGFSMASDRFATLQNFENILLQSAHLAILALGVSLVMLVSGIDLSLGAVMYAGAAITGILAPEAGILAWLLGGTLIGALVGAINGFFVVRIGVAAFIVTLAGLFVLRGLGLWVSDTRMVFASDEILAFSRASILGVPVPIAITIVLTLGIHVLLTLTPFGRNVYAIGDDPEGARRAGLPVQRTILMLFVLSGAFAGLAGILLMSQIAAASSTFGEQKEFLAIAAAVLGGTSLFGGRGNAFGPVLGAILIQTVQNGLVLMNTDPYYYPLVTGLVIFLVVLIDTLRNGLTQRLMRRRVRA